MAPLITATVLVYRTERLRKKLQFMTVHLGHWSKTMKTAFDRRKIRSMQEKMRMIQNLTITVTIYVVSMIFKVWDINVLGR